MHGGTPYVVCSRPPCRRCPVPSGPVQSKCRSGAGSRFSRRPQRCSGPARKRRFSCVVIRNRITPSQFAITCTAVAIAAGGLRTYGQGRSTLKEVPLPHTDTGERVTPVLDFPSRDGLAVQAIRVDYAPGGFARG